MPTLTDIVADFCYEDLHYAMTNSVETFYCLLSYLAENDDEELMIR